MIFKPVDWDEYNQPPFFPEWMSCGETLDLAKFDDSVKTDTNRVIDSMAEQYDLEKAKGILLDRAGKLLNQPRKGQDDERYRSWLKLKAMINNSTGTVNEIIDIIEFVYQAANIKLEPNYPAGLKIRHDGEDSFDSELNKRIAAALPAGISYTVTEIFSFIENLIVSESVQIKPVRRDVDVYPGGLRYDGRWKYDHGEFLRLDGTRKYDGSWPYDVVIGKKGTITDVRHIPSYYDGIWVFGGARTYSGDTLLNDPEELPNPVTFNSRQHDEMSSHVKLARLEDTSEIVPRYDGHLMYLGWKYGSGNPSMIETSMEIQITRNFLLNGRWVYWGRSFDGSWKYDGSLVYSSGITYSGKQVSMEVIV
jgi:hypothetical protein